MTLGAVGSAGISLGLWLWLATRPTARVLTDAGGVAYVHAPARLAWPIAVSLGVATVAVATLGVGALVARRRQAPLGESIGAVASATLPLCLLLVGLGRLLVPAGWLTGPLPAFAYDLREGWAAGVALTVLVLFARLLWPVPPLPDVRPARLPGPSVWARAPPPEPLHRDRLDPLSTRLARPR
jgi:hypothetical protein